MMRTTENFGRIAPTWRLAMGMSLAAAIFVAIALNFGGAELPDAAVAFAQADSEEARDPNRLWCNEHDIYEDECVICHPEIAAKPKEEARDPNRLWCNEHDIYEDECVICHPEIAMKPKEEARDPNRLWCNEHDVYEDECLICHPELATARDEHGDHAHAGASMDTLWCAEHDVAEIECAICQPQLLRDIKPGGSMKIRFPSLQSAQKAGVRTSRPTPLDSVTAGEQLVGTISYNRNALAYITPFAGGVIASVGAEVGDRVSAGQDVAAVRAPRIAEAKSAYIKALADERLHGRTLAREKDLVAQKISAQREYEAALADYESSRSDVAMARQQLLNLGLSADEVSAIGSENNSDSLLPVRAPFDGTIIERDAVLGAAVEAGESLYQIADLSTMWLEISVPETYLGAVAVGAPVAVTADAFPGDVFEARMVWISPEVDPRTRTVAARAVLPNPSGQFRNGMFAYASVARERYDSAYELPGGSVQFIEGRPVVFAEIEPDLFESRVVETGPSADGRVTILSGISQDDRIVTAESFILKSEFLKARLGAGCVDH